MYPPIIYIYEKKEPQEKDVFSLNWSNFTNDINQQSILNIEPFFFSSTREEFLLFIEQCGRATIDGESLRNIIRLPDGFSLWWLSDIFERHPNFYDNNLFEIFKLRAFEHYTQDWPSTHIILCSENKALAQVLEHWCQKKGHLFTWQKYFLRSPNFIKRCKEALKSSLLGRMLQLFFSLKKWWFTIRKKYPSQPRVVSIKGLLLGTWYPNFDPEAAAHGRYHSRYWEDAHKLFDAHKRHIHWFWINADPAEKILAGVKQREKFRDNAGTKQDFTFWEECITFGMAAKVLWQACYICWKGRKILRHLPKICQWPNSDLNVTPLLRSVWEKSLCGFSLLKGLLLYHAIKRYCKLIGPQYLCLTSTELQSWERLLFRESRKVGTKQIYAAVHTRISPSDFRYFIAPHAWQDQEFIELMPDKLLANGKAAYDALSNSMVPADRLGKVEALRFMHLLKNDSLPPIPPQCLLVPTSYFPPNNETLLRTLGEALKTSSLPILHKVLIKPHPLISVDELLTKFFSSPPPIVEGPIEKFLTPGTIVYADSSTSVAQLALYKHLPLIVHAPENNFDLGSLSYIPGVQYIRNCNEFLQAVAKHTIVQLPEEYFFLDPKLTRWRSLLKNFK